MDEEDKDGPWTLIIIGLSGATFLHMGFKKMRED